jgi:hypothetical protein
MKDNNLEKQFRKGLRDLEAGPPDGAKEAIEKHLLDTGLLKDKADAKGGLWMFLLLAVLIATPVIYALRKTQKVQIAESSSTNTAVMQQAENSIGYTSTKQEKENANVLSISDKNEAGNNSNHFQASARHERKQIAGKQARVKTKVMSSSGLAVNSKIKKKAKNSSIKNNKGEVISPDALALANNNIDIAATIQTASQSDGRPTSASEGKSEPDKLEEKKDTLAEKEHPALKDTSSHPKLPVEKIHKEVAFDFSGAPQFNSIVYGNGSEYYQHYVDESRQSEKETPSFCAAFGIVVSLNKFILETGIRHSVLASEFSYEQTVLTFHKLRSYGSPSPWAHDSVQTTTHYIANNKIAFMEFPLLLGYRVHAGKFEFELKTGPMMSFITSANTTVISLNTGTVVQSNDLESSPYRKVCWSALSAGNILYSIDSRFSAFVQPSLKTGITSIFKESAPVTKKVQSVCVGIGLRVNL